MKKLIVLVVVVALVALVIPVLNLLVKPDNSKRMARLGLDDAAVCALLEEKCVVCHTPDAKLPFYAGFPVARNLIEGDIAKARRHLDWTEQAPSSEVALAKLEHAVSAGDMPPLRFELMHWDAGLTAGERDTILAWVRAVRAERYATFGAAPAHAASPVQPLVAKTGLNPELVELGKELFHDVRLSGDDTVSCATCHGLFTGGCDRVPVSTGIGGQKGGINSPTVYNAGPNLAQFWDGRAADLVEQAGGPVANPIEMGAEWPAVVERLRRDTALAARFDELFSDGLTQENVQRAIACFEESLVTTGSKFDRYLTGEAGALTADEERGYELFLETGCATCHVGETLGGQSFETMGLHGDYFAARGHPTPADEGRAAVTGDEADRHAFKVPTLRNIALTYPYFHDGSTSDLAEAVQTMAKYQVGRTLATREVDQIVAFLHTLTGEYEGELLK